MQSKKGRRDFLLTSVLTMNPFTGLSEPRLVEDDHLIFCIKVLHQTLKIHDQVIDFFICDHLHVVD